MKIKMTSIPVDDPIVAHEFYTKTLGFSSLMFMPEMKLAIVVSSEEKQGTSLMLEPNENPISNTFQKAVFDQGLPIIVLGSDNVQSEYERLKDKGVVFKQSPTKTDWGTMAVFNDTCGNWIQIHQDL